MYTICHIKTPMLIARYVEIDDTYQRKSSSDYTIPLKQEAVMIRDRNGPSQMSSLQSCLSSTLKGQYVQMSPLSQRYRGPLVIFHPL